MKAVLAWPSRIGLSVRIVAGLALGVLTVLFFGEGAAVLQPLADVYIRLMQMTVLPYLLMALIIGFGQLEAGEARRLAVRGRRAAAGHARSHLRGDRGDAGGLSD